MPLDWSLLGPVPDIPGAVRQGFEYGRANRKRQQQESAFGELAQNPDDPSAIAALAATGPEGMRAAWAFQDRGREDRQRDLRRSIFTPTGETPSAFGPVAPPMPAAPAADTASQGVMPPSGAVAPPAASQSLFNQQALEQYFVEDPAGAKQIVEFIKGQSDQQREALQNEIKGAAPLLLQLMSTPDINERKAMVQQARPLLNQLGWDDNEIAQRTGDLSDRTLKAYAALGAGIEHYRSTFAPNDVGQGQTGLDPFTRKPLYRTPTAPQTRTSYDAEGREFIVSIPGDPGFGLGGIQGFAPATSSAPTAGGTGFDAIYEGFVKPQEGGYAASDGRSGAPVNFGINQKANPDIDVANLTPEQAKQIMRDRYWTPSGAGNLTGPLQAIHFDTAVNMGVAAAKDLLEQSGGDAAKYMDLREARHRSLGGSDQAVWDRRNSELRRFAGVGEAAPRSDGQRFTGGTRPGGARKPSETRAVGGKTYYKVDGRWYDNPEGK